MAGHHENPGGNPNTTEELSGRQRLRAMAQALFGKAFLPFWLCLGVAAAIVPLSEYISPIKRISNLDLRETGFSPSYLMTSKATPDKGYLVDRRDSTVRRSRKNLPGKMWDLDRFGQDAAAGIPEHYLLRSKRYGTVFLVPAEAVEDFDYPFVYSFVRREYPELELPEGEWTNLFLNRVYHGLYLRMALPFDLRKKDGGNGTMRELFMIRDNEMTLVDTRFNPDARFYEEGTTLGIFPALKEPPPVLAWLAARCPTADATLVLKNTEPYEVSLLPLPYSLDRLYQRIEGAALRPTLDERFRRWTAPASEYEGAPPPFDAARRERFEAEYQDYQRRLEIAVAAHRALRPEAVLSVEAPSESAQVGQLQPEGARP
jgi:hypothetical protein